MILVSKSTQVSKNHYIVSRNTLVLCEVSGPDSGLHTVWLNGCPHIGLNRERCWEINTTVDAHVDTDRCRYTACHYTSVVLDVVYHVVARLYLLLMLLLLVLLLMLLLSSLLALLL